ncbi:MAG: double-strand break repair protein AddB [Pseudomonadota bacterium]
MPNIFEAPRPRVFNIEAGRAFSPTLAQGIVDAVERDDPFALADIRIYAPTRRAARGLMEAFGDLMANGGSEAGVAFLAPRILTLGDLDDPESGDIEGAGDVALGLDLAPAMSESERLIALAGLVARKDAAFKGQENWPAALSAARELAALLDSLYTEEIPFSALATAAPAEHAAHWAQSLEFLQIVTDAWPRYLAERDRSDPAERRAAVIGALAERWRAAPPSGPVIIAGTTGSAPAVARLAAAVAAAPKGAVVLPGLDSGLDARGWRSVDDGHPQAGLKALLERLGLSPSDARSWPGGGNAGGDADAGGETSARRRLLSVALRPATATDDWRALAGDLKQGGGAARALAGLELVEAPREDAEAAMIAMRLRDAIEDPAATAMLVTPDRDLARRVASKMRRWGITIDDSAGVPLPATAAGGYLRLVAAFLSHAADPARLLALLDHPFFALHGLDDARIKRRIDIALRGPAPVARAGAFSAIHTRIRDALTEDDIAIVRDSLSHLEALTDAWPARAPLADYLSAHAAAAERMTGSPRMDAAAQRAIWTRDDGREAVDLIAGLMDALSDDEAIIDARDYPAAFLALAAGKTVRAGRRAHPRLAILGPLEARLQHADVVILGGLNEGVWPGDAGLDPFLSRTMRRAIGLPSPERRIGLAAHDFAQFAAAKRVMLTRSVRSSDGPTKPSRWLIRLKNLIDGVDAVATPPGPLARALDATNQYADWSDAIEAIDAPPPRLSQPAPRPSIDARPRRISVTRIEKWLRDPYAVYASEILKLRKLDDPGAAFGVRELGSLFHKVFERAGERDVAASMEALRQDFQDLAPGFGLDVSDAALWSAAVDRALERFIAYDAERRARGRPVIIEDPGSAMVPGVTPAFEVYGVADRIDLQADGSALIIDYKSSRPGSEKELAAFNPQLEVLALIARTGGFDALPSAAISGFEFFVFLANQGGVIGRATNEDGALGERIDGAARRLKELVEAFDHPQTPYLSQPRPKFKDRYGDYDVLARRREWADADGADAASDGNDS